MTVCVGAVCCDLHGKERRAVVVASDRMVTMGQVTEFEHEVPKLTHLTDHAVSLFAGDALRGMRIVRSVIAQFKASPAGGVPQIAEATAAHYAGLRLEQVNNEIFRPRGLNIQAFYAGGLQQSLNQQITLGLDNLAVQLNYGVELLVGGVDGDGGHLFHIANPGGTYTALDHTGFGAIGSGALHAIQSMIQLRHAPTHAMHETVFEVYASKRRAEVAPGVGHDTDLAIIDEAGIFRLDRKVMESLDDIYERFSRPVERELLAEVQKLQLLPEGKEKNKDATVE